MCRSICQHSEWNDGSILRRAKDLYQLAVEIWNIPEKYDNFRESTAVIDYSAIYSIMTNINITGEKPKQFILLDMEYSVSSWKDLLRSLCHELFELDSTIFYNLIKQKDFSGRERYIINDTSTAMTSPYEIADNLYIETNLSAMDILNYCKIICSHYQITDDIYFVLNQNK